MITKPVEQAGFTYIYLSNESNTTHDVYFDDLVITHTSANATLQAHDYYPFGLPMEGSNSFLEAGVEPNRFLYQGKEWQTELGLNLYDFHARQFDPALGRFISVDAVSQFSSPYLGMGNIPTMGVDPDGNIFFIFPSISFNGEFSISLTAGFGIPKLFDISGIVGYNFNQDRGFASVGVTAGPVSFSYGTGGLNASVGYGFNKSGFNAGVGLNYNFSEKKVGLGYSVGYGHRFESGRQPNLQGVIYEPNYPEVPPGTVQLKGVDGLPRLRTKELPDIVDTDATYETRGYYSVTITGRRWSPPYRLLNPTGYHVRNEASGSGYYGASRDGGARRHLGLDLLSAVNQTISAPADGEVFYRSTGSRRVSFRPGDSELLIDRMDLLYANPPEGAKHGVWLPVRRGQNIGTQLPMSTFGYSINVTSHIHIQIISNGNWVNPLPYFFPYR